MVTQLIAEISEMANQLKEKLNLLRNEIWEELMDISPDDTYSIENHAGKMKSLNATIDEYERYHIQLIDKLKNYTINTEKMKVIECNNLNNQDNPLFSLREYLRDHKPYMIRFRGKSHYRNNWNEVFTWLASEVISLKQFTEQELVNDKIFWGNKRHYFSFDRSDLWKPEKVSDNVWMETNLSANGFRDVMVNLLNKAGISIDEVEIELRR